jgi:cytochrome c oxidase subunit 1
MHWAGLLGSPRRTSDVSYLGAAAAQVWHPEMVSAAIGGAILFVSILMFVYVAVGTRISNERPDVPPEFRFAAVDAEAMETPAIFDRLGLWGTLAIVLALLAYAGPLHEQFSHHHYLAPGMRTW